MAIFKVKVRVITVVEVEILVKAESKDAALHYLNTNIDWHDDNAFDGGERYTQSFSPIDNEVQEITSMKECPDGWDEDGLPWNGGDETSVKDLLG